METITGHMPSHCMDQWRAHRPEISAEAERDLGTPDTVAARMSNARTGVIQPDDRQQVTRCGAIRSASLSRCDSRADRGVIVSRFATA